MSYIDSGYHELCGWFNGLPLYHPLAPYVDEHDFVADEKNLVLGGGGGEHAAAVLNPMGCAYYYILDVVREFAAHEDFKEVTGVELHEEKFLVALAEALGSARHTTPAAIFSAWSGDDWAHFVKNSETCYGLGWHAQPRGDESIENWVISSIGEYVLVSQFAWVLEAVGALNAELAAIRQFTILWPRYANVVTSTPGYDHGGRPLP